MIYPAYENFREAISYICCGCVNFSHRACSCKLYDYSKICFKKGTCRNKIEGKSEEGEKGPRI